MGPASCRSKTGWKPVSHCEGSTLYRTLRFCSACYQSKDPHGGGCPAVSVLCFWAAGTGKFSWAFVAAAAAGDKRPSRFYHDGFHDAGLGGHSWPPVRTTGYSGAAGLPRLNSYRDDIGDDR
ncbi:MAG: hypothetical protein AMXMBFR13_10460 [Phycisphaerae bacterium]